MVEKTGGDLLVVGSSRRGPWGRVLLGDDTRAALHDAPCAVAVAPQGYDLETSEIDRIGVGYDRSSESEHALTVARALGERLGAQLTAFRAIPVAAGSPPGDGACDKPVPVLGADSEVGYGEPSVELAFFSDSVDLLVVGTRDNGPNGRLPHASTATDLARSAGCPLLVVGGARTERASGPAGSAQLHRPVG